MNPFNATAHCGANWTGSSDPQEVTAPSDPMPRTIEVSASPEIADSLLERLQKTDGIVGLSRHRGASLDPQGDILVIQTTNDGARPVFALLDELGVERNGAILTNSPRSLFSPKHKGQIDQESNETVWDEMAFHLRQETNIGFNYLALMFLSGAVAATGLWADKLHLIIGAMVIAPAFEPFVRIPFGLIAGPSELTKRGIFSCASGYLALAGGALIAVLILRVIDPAAASDLEARQWVRYWSSFSSPGVLVSIFAAIAGAIVVCGLRSVLTTGVMIALALVPSLSVAAMAIGMGDLPLAWKGVLRWGVDAGIVMFVSAVVISAKQRMLHRRKAIG